MDVKYKVYRFILCVYIYMYIYKYVCMYVCILLNIQHLGKDQG